MYFLAPICRVCISNDSILININNLDNDKISFYNKVKLCFPDIIFENTSIQTYICQNCCSNLKKVHEFRKLCMDSDSALKRYILQLENANSLKDKSQNKLHELIDENYKDLNSIIKSVPKLQIDNSEIDMKVIKTENTNFKYVDNVWLEPTCVVNIKNEEIKLDDIDSGFQDFITEDQSEHNIYKNIYVDSNSLSQNTSDTSRLNGLIGHKLNDNREKRFHCDVCSKGFNYSGQLQRHMRIHTGEKPYVCNICFKNFNRLDHLQKHNRIHTDEKPYVCDVCLKSFNRLDHLQKHKRIHTDEKPYECDVCSKRFNRLDHLQKHKRTHTGEKPYVCDVCSKGFNRSDHLRKHTRIHTGEVPYVCDVCSESFSELDKLFTHKIIHASEKPYEYNEQRFEPLNISTCT